MQKASKKPGSTGGAAQKGVAAGIPAVLSRMGPSLALPASSRGPERVLDAESEAAEPFVGCL